MNLEIALLSEVEIGKETTSLTCWSLFCKTITVSFNELDPI